MLRQYVFKSRRPFLTSIRLYRTKGSKNVKISGKAAPSTSIKSSAKGVIAPGSDQHNDLPSFLDYAKRLDVSPISTVYLGTYYEYTVATTLRQLGFDLTRTGRQSDYGIDLLGHWHVPSIPTPIRVLLQCKAHSKALTPANVRELEGAFPGAPAGWRGEGVLGFLAATSQATKGMRDAMTRSSLPMGFFQVTAEGKVLQFIWNHEATQRGLEGMGATSKFSPVAGSKNGNGVEQEVALTWNGWMLSKESQVISLPPTVSKEKVVKTAFKRTSKAKDKTKMVKSKAKVAKATAQSSTRATSKGQKKKGK